MTDTVILKISKGRSGCYQVCSVTLRKLRLLAVEKHSKWTLNGDFLVLSSGEG